MYKRNVNHPIDPERLRMSTYLSKQGLGYDSPYRWCEGVHRELSSRHEEVQHTSERPQERMQFEVYRKEYNYHDVRTAPSPHLNSSIDFFSWGEDYLLCVQNLADYNISTGRSKSQGGKLIIHGGHALFCVLQRGE